MHYDWSQVATTPFETYITLLVWKIEVNDYDAQDEYASFRSSRSWES